jgi:ABC-2 type transport system ATP-binding protein
MEVRGLTRRFGARVAVQSLDLTVRRGDVYGFLGPNGAGKTTAMRCIVGLLRPHEGSVSIFGESHPVRSRRSLGAMIETPAFHDWMSGRDNLWLSACYLGLPDPAAELDRVLARVGLSERALDRAGAYSLGMRQRLAIARALLGGPKLLLLDEPTNGLDPRGMHEVRELVRSLALHDGITVFISTHLLAEVQAICNRVGILQQGRLQAEGTVDELMSQGVGASATVVDVSTRDRAALEALVERLDGVELRGDGPHGSVQLRLGAGREVADLVADLVGGGVRVDAVVPQRRSLEDVFLELTG